MDGAAAGAKVGATEPTCKPGMLSSRDMSPVQCTMSNVWALATRHMGSGCLCACQRCVPHMLAIRRVDRNEVRIAQVRQTKRPQPVQILSVLAGLPQHIAHAAQEEACCTYLYLRCINANSDTSYGILPLDIIHNDAVMRRNGQCFVS